MKNLIAVLLLLNCFTLSAQQKISGIYTGTLYNDTTKQVQNYELALSEYRGKITGYSYVTFVSNDTFYYGIRRIKAKVEGDNLIVEDDKIIGNNFPESPAKGVKRMFVIPLKGQDSVVSLNGRWQTNATKVYYSVPGSVDLGRTEDSSSSALVSHLKELNIIGNPQQTGIAAAPQRAKEVKASPEKDDAVAKAKKEQEMADQQKRDALALARKQDEKAAKAVDREQKRENAIAKKEQQKEEDDRVKAEREARKVEALAKKERDKQEEARVKAEREAKQEDAKVAAIAITPPEAPVKLPFDQRREVVQQTVDFVQDSIVLSLYDNGVVDGDSVSVFLNGQNVMTSTKLLTSATKKVIYLKEVAGDEIRLVLVADNLGTLPPNTGLLVIKDGEQTYQLNFKADMQTNATIILLRKKK
jgi:flagellar biosynthesis GTPase FlhF